MLYQNWIIVSVENISFSFIFSNQQISNSKESQVFLDRTNFGPFLPNMPTQVLQLLVNYRCQLTNFNSLIYYFWALCRVVLVPSSITCCYRGLQQYRLNVLPPEKVAYSHSQTVVRGAIPRLNATQERVSATPGKKIRV